MSECFDKAFLKVCLDKLGLGCGDADSDRFEEFFLAITEFNKAVNLTTIIDQREFIIKHIADSLSAMPLFPQNASVADIGPGGGFPSIPLKILRNDLSFALFEAVGKKTAFLNSLKEKLGLERVDCFHLRAEEAAGKGYRGSFDAVVARAVAPLNTLLEYALPLLKKNGLLIAYKGSEKVVGEEIIRAEHATKLLGGILQEKRTVFLPFSEDRRTLVVYRKTHSTPTVYPRLGNKPRLSPL
ncbi:MAG: 16S rRNA (guanine(527)-N(7))-methyltransferase RsmG [Clostridiales bacterium]|jgi:16S rRNA (guanine527-N7)-methyltransferase|nr:16S rRNA (guanine(527)-N(7))-methyltransferase RsmG [Clostridiales bacterium]